MVPAARKHRRSLSFTVAAAVVLLQAGCATLDRNTPREAGTALAKEQARGTLLGEKWASVAPEDGESSAFRLLPDNLEAFAARIALIDAAERTLDLQYYIFASDDTGLFILDRLVSAADRGVRVRILVDDMTAHGTDRLLAAMDAHPRIELRVFNPWTQRKRPVARIAEFLVRPRLNHRMHNKLMVADGTLALLGGRNLADEYYDLSTGFNFRDLDVAALGPVAAEAGSLFDRFWNSPDAVPITGLRPALDTAALLAAERVRLAEHREKMKNSDYARAIRATTLVEELTSGSTRWVFARGRVIGDTPDKTRRPHGLFKAQPFGSAISDALNSARRELLISTPYFVPRTRGTAGLAELVARGVRVSVLTNTLASNDLAVVHAMYAKYRRKLIRGGVQLYELRRRGAREPHDGVRHRGFGSTEASLHAKTFVVDRERVFVGSLNLDPRSTVYNTEVGVLIESPELAESVAQSITAMQSPLWSYRLELGPGNRLHWMGENANGAMVRINHDPDTSWWSRFSNRLLGLLPIEGMT